MLGTPHVIHRITCVLISTEMAIKLIQLLDRDTYYPTYDRVIDSLPIRDIIALTKTCKSFSSIYQDILHKQWNINRHLRRWVEDPRSFRCHMARCNALITNDLALEFFERVRYPNAYLDLCMETGPSAVAFQEHLIEHESYSLDYLMSPPSTTDPCTVQDVG